jgi:hypothetical protein
MLAYVAGEIVAVDGYEILFVCLCGVWRTAVERGLRCTLGHHTSQTDRQYSISSYCTDFTCNIRQHISSLRGTQKLIEDGNKLPKHVEAQD